MVEIIFSAAGLVAILIFGMQGAKSGLFRSLAGFLFTLLGLLIAMRFWYPLTEWIGESVSVPAEQLAFAIFWAVLALATLPFSAGLNSLNQEFVPDYWIPLERFFGFIFGAARGGLLAAAFLISILLNLPQFYPAFNESKMLLPLHRMPDLLYRNAEKFLAGSNTDPQSRTLLPTGERTSETDPLRVTWK